MYLLPIPRSVVMANGTLELDLYSKIVMDWDPSPIARTAAVQLQQELAACGLPVEILCGKARPGDIFLTVQPQQPAQGYRVEIDAQGVTVCGNDAAGLGHGVQTLRQIIRQSGCVLPTLTIEDEPAMAARGFYHDVTRGRTPTLEWLKQLADAACFYKLNQLQLYVEHTYLFRDLTEVWRVGQPLSAAEIMEFDDYCAARGIELVPSLSTFGHLLELLRTKSYCDLCELPEAETFASGMHNRMAHHTLNPADPRSLEVVKRMIDEFMPMFRSRQFNICCDETFDLGKGRNRERMEELGEGEVYISFVKEICDYVVSLGRRPMFWGDIVLRSADALNRLPEGTICLNWGYSPEQKEDPIRIMADVGAVQYVCPGVCGWNQWANLLHDSYSNITRMAAYGRKYHAVGMLNTDWGDYGHVNDPRLSVPGMIYGAQFSWSNSELSFEELNQAISVLEYSDRSGKVLECVARMDGCSVYGWRELVQAKEKATGEIRAVEGRPDFAICRPELVEEKNAELSRIQTQLKNCMLHMDADKRSMLEPWLVAAQALQVWNLAGRAVHLGQKDAAIAECLERWLPLFEHCWRSVSKESELWRTRSMVAWYADKLR